MIEILQKLEQLEKLVASQTLVQKPVLTLDEACQYLELSQSHMYKLTSRKQIPFYCPNGKKIYFNRKELDEWVLKNRSDTGSENETAAINYIIASKPGRGKR